MCMHTTLESAVSLRHLQDHRTILIRIICASLATEMGIGHLGCLSAHQTNVLPQTGLVISLDSP